MSPFTPGIWVYVVITSIVLLLGVFCNALVIYCVRRYKKLRTITNVLICNLATSDILLSGFVLPQRLHDISHQRDFFEGEFLCRIVNSFPIFVITTSIYTLVCVSFERRRAIVFNSQPRMSYRQLYRIIALIWFLGLAASVPSLIEYSVNTVTETRDVENRTYISHIASCDSQRANRAFSITNAIYIISISYIVPVILMFRNYVHVAMYVWKKRRETRDVANASGSSAEYNNGTSLGVFRTRVKVVKILMVVALIFAASWLPFYVLLVYVKITQNDASVNAGSYVNLFLIAMATLSTTSDIVLYVAFNPTFRKIIKATLRCSTHSDVDCPVT